MHPAFSVILFTCLSGAGYGLLAVIGFEQVGARIVHERSVAIVAILAALVLVSVGLLASTFHLGHPERAWRAFTQWRSSWLSREAVLAVFTYVPALLVLTAYVASSDAWVHNRTLGVVLLIFALATVFCTAMIYASLRSIPAWFNVYVPLSYLLLALMSGAAWAIALRVWSAADVDFLVHLALVTAAAALVTKMLYWHRIDAGKEKTTAASAIGASQASAVRLVQSPHSEANYLQQEMGFRIAREHARQLRLLAIISGFLLPLVLYILTIVDVIAVNGWIAGIVLVLTMGGVFVERWLFFAEAKHVVMSYYER